MPAEHRGVQAATDLLQDLLQSTLLAKCEHRIKPVAILWAVTDAARSRTLVKPEQNLLMRCWIQRRVQEQPLQEVLQDKRQRCSVQNRT